jgi:beta-glucanase (GH16 family)
MKSQFSASSMLLMPWTMGKTKKRNSSILRRYNVSGLHQQLISFVFIVSVTALLIMIRNLAPQQTSSATQRITYPYASLFNTKILSGRQPTIAAKPPKASALAVVAAPCTTQASADGEPFASCPSFSLNFATQPQGALSPKDFNIYSGKPVANQEAELYTGSQQNLQIKDGTLNLTALHNPQQGFNYTSARIDTEGKEDFLYGKLVVRATLPDGIGAWPAIWMLSATNKYEELSPPSDPNRYLNDGEIDIAESVGTQPHVVYEVAHSLAYPSNGVTQGYYNTIAVPNNESTFHDYGLEWTPTSLTFTIDGQPYFSMKKQPGANYRSWPYDQPFYLILNLALGGSWGGTDRQQFPADGVDPSILPASMKIQSINYYRYIAAHAASNN